MEDGKNRFYEFGDFRVDTRRRILLKNDEPLPLSPRNFDLLIFLIENEGRVLSHDELLDTVWEGTFVEQANLKNAVSVLRKILGEGPSEGFYIRTIPRRGYSFVASVRRIIDEVPATAFVYEETEREVVVEETWEDDAPNLVQASVEPKLLAGEQPAATSGSKRRSLLAAFALVAVVALFFGIRTYFAGPGPIRFSAENVSIRKITAEGDLIGGDSSISPNGNYLVYAIRESENVSLWTKQISTGISRQISPKMAGSVWACALTPDEDFIYYIFNSNDDMSQSGLFKISTFGGRAQKISDNTGGGLSISPDGKRIAVCDLTPDLITRIETMDLDGGNASVVWSSKENVRIWDIKYSPDGSSLLFAIRKQLPDRSVYYVAEIPAAGGPEKVIVPEQEKQIAHAIWLPDKKSVLLSIREINAELRQIWQYFPAGGEWKRVTNDNASYRGFSLTKDGKTLVASQESRLTSLWASPTGTASDLTQILPGTHYLITSMWTADSSIVYSGIENSREAAMIINADGSGNRPLTSGDDGIWLFPAPSRDGGHIVFAANRSGKRQIWAMDNEGRNPVQLTNLDTDVYDGRLLSDGKTCIYLQNLTPQTALLVKRGPDGQTKTLTDFKPRRWAISPDEKYVAVQIEDPGTKKAAAAIIDLASGETIRKLDIAFDRVLRWTPDGKALAYDLIEPGGGKIMVRPIDGGPAKVFLNLPGEDPFNFDWSFDGKRFVLIRGKHLTDAVEISVGPKQ